MRKAIADAAHAGDYSTVDAARFAAGQILQLHGDMEAVMDSLRSESVPERNSDRKTRGPSKRRSSKRDYPKFQIRDGVLQKVGWSKKSNEEYVHKIPREAFDGTLHALSEIRARGDAPITADQVVGHLESKSSAIPLYQVYVTLALLRDRGIARKDGRDGYRIEHDIVPRGKDLWQTIAGRT